MTKKGLWILAVPIVVILVVIAGILEMFDAGILDTDKKANASSYEKTQKVAGEKAKLLTDKYGMTSVQYALIDHDQIVVSGQTGRNDEKGKQPLTGKTMYGIGSTSKMFVAAAVMKLVDEKKIDLDTPVVEYVPDFKMKDERYQKITPRMLLNHSSGLYGSSMANSLLMEDNDSYAHDTLLKQLAEQKLKADPGQYSVYCNDGFTLAEIMVEKVSGMDFTSYIHQHFTKPLGMSHTKTPMDSVDTSQMAGLYDPTAKFKGQLPNESVNVIGAGGIYSTAEDLARFSQIFTGQTEGILSKKSISAMEKEEYKKGMWPEETDNTFNFGLGWDSVHLFPFSDYNIKALSKGGDTNLYHASLVVLPEKKMAVAVLTSGGDSLTDQLLGNQILLHALKEKGDIDKLKPAKSHGKPEQADLPTSLRKEAGIYGSSRESKKVEISKDGEMTVSSLNTTESSPLMPEAPPEKYVYTGDGSFVSPDGSDKVNFVKLAGRTYLWNQTYISMPGLGQTALSHYSAQKIEDHEISDKTAATWKERDGKRYYPISEKYTSMTYLLMSTLKLNLPKETPGYIADQKITGTNTSGSELQIPTMYGRDLQTFEFYQKDGVEYLSSLGTQYVREDGLKPIDTVTNSSVTIPASGHAQWYKVSEQAAGKTMKVTMPEKASFAVYDKTGLCENFSVVSGDQEVKLPKGGTIVFAGDAQVKMEVSVK